MTEQPPSAASLWTDLVEKDDRTSPEEYPDMALITFDEFEYLLNHYAAQRVSAETVSWQNRDRQRLEQIDRLQTVVQSFQSASAERPAPEPTCEGGVPLGKMGATCPKCGATDNDICGYVGASAERPAPDPLEQARQSGFEQGIAAAAEYVEARPNEQPAVLAGLMRDLGSMYAAERPAPNLHWHEGPPYCERPAPEGPQQGGYVIEVEFDDGDEAQRAYDAIETMLGEMGQIGTLGMRSLPSATEGPQPDVWTEEDIRAAQAKADELVKAFEQQDAAADYTEQAREIVRAVEFHLTRLDGADEYAESTKVVAAALSAVASEHDAAAIRAFGQRVWSDTEEVAYRAGVSDTREKLQEPNVRGAVAKAIYDIDPIGVRDWSNAPASTCEDCFACADAAIAKIVEMLK